MADEEIERLEQEPEVQSIIQDLGHEEIPNKDSAETTKLTTDSFYVNVPYGYDSGSGILFLVGVAVAITVVAHSGYRYFSGG